MDRRFLMQNNDWLVHSRNGSGPLTQVSESLRDRLLVSAMERACLFYCRFFEASLEHIDFDEWLSRYKKHETDAQALGLFQPGGIQEKTHLNLWCLANIFAPEIYIESGVFIGSSLHAFIGSPSVQKVIGIDPNLSRLRVPKRALPPTEFLDSRDFSQIDDDFSKRRALAYFDDHVDSAGRILQSCRNGLRYVLFDDSTGLEGICQRKYPAVPTVPMIMNIEMFQAGDKLSWVPGNSGRFSPRAMIKLLLSRGKTPMNPRVSLVVTQQLIEKCLRAREQVKRYERLPDLGEFFPQRKPKAVIDSSMYLVELK